jgi:outer membrane murein-binding lipoprotein Lpp
MLPFRQSPSLRQIGTSVLLALCLSGCAHRGDVEVLESELRKREQAQEGLASELTQAREELKIARSDAADLRDQLTVARQVSLAPEQAEVLYRAEAIKFNMLLTSGQDRDKVPGDEGLSIMLMPVDAHGDLVKLAGEVEFELFDMTQSAEQQRLGHWQFTIDEVREHWHRGFISSGYLFQVDWQGKPASPDLTLHARLSVPDGRRFDTTAQVKVALAPGGRSSGVMPAAHSAPRPTASKARKKAKPAGRVVPASTTAPSPPSVPSVKSAAASPAEEPLEIPADEAPPVRTSDRFTEETIPKVR